MDVSTRLAAALSAWREALGSEKVLTDAATLESLGRTTQASAPKPGGVLRPSNTGEVQSILRIATEYRAPVHPVSCGRNWGYGDACPPQEGAVIIDLSALNRIIEVNTEMAYAVIEPGVTQGRLYRYLQELRTGLWMDSTGAGPDASVVGNALERGFGHTPYGDHFATICGLEVVLPDGKILNTGFGHRHTAEAERCYAYGIGPVLDGLFSQSNLGIVTRMGIWLMPAPESFTAFFMRANDPGALPEIVERLRPLRLQGHLRSAVHVANDLRVLSGRMRYPFAETEGKTPLPDDVRDRMRRAAGIGPWNLSGALVGSASQVGGARKAVRSALSGFGKLVFLGDGKLALCERLLKGLNSMGMATGLGAQLRFLRPNYDLLKGVPVSEPLMGTQWRLRHAPASVSDPRDHGCGIMWISPVLPLRGRDATHVMKIVEPIFAAHRFECLATFTAINARAMIAILNVAFDKSLPEECAAAQSCYEAAIGALSKAGYPPYRVGLAGMKQLYGTDAYAATLNTLKQSLDPAGILSPGKYL